MSMAMVCRRTKRGDVEICTDEITLVLVHEHVACARRVADRGALHMYGNVDVCMREVLLRVTTKRSQKAKILAW